MSFDPVNIGIWIVVGAIAGWIADRIVKWASLGLIGDTIVGLLGAVLAGYLLPRAGVYLGVGLVAEIVNAAIGAVILLLIARLGKQVITKPKVIDATFGGSGSGGE